LGANLLVFFPKMAQAGVEVEPKLSFLCGLLYLFEVVRDLLVSYIVYNRVPLGQGLRTIKTVPDSVP